MNRRPARAGMPPGHARARRFAPLAALAATLVLVSMSGSYAASPGPGGSPATAVPAPTVPGTTLSTPGAADTRRVEVLRSEAEALFEKLAEATAAYEAGQREVLAAQNAAALARGDAAARQATLDRARVDLEAYVDAAYRNPIPHDVLLLTLQATGSPDALQTASYLTAVSQMQNGIVTRVAKARAAAEHAAERAQDLEAVAAEHAAELDRQRQRLVEQSGEITQRLTAEVTAIAPGGARASSAQIWSCDGTQLVGFGSWPNGLLPDSVLCPLPQDGHTLRGDAAATFRLMNDAFRADIGRDLCVTESYRTLARQQYFYATRPALAAVPGRSNHGWGLAVDFCEGEGYFDTTEYRWLKANSMRWGWVHPAWAEPDGSRPEPWHWEYALG